MLTPNAHVGQQGYPCGPAGGGGPGCAPGSSIVVGVDVTPETLWTRIGTLPAGQTANAFQFAAAGTIGYVTFTSRCSWRPRALFLQIRNMGGTAADAAIPVGTVMPADLVSMFVCTVDQPNILGGRDELTNYIPTTLFSEAPAGDTPNDCCFLLGGKDIIVPAGASVILGIRTRGGYTARVQGVSDTVGQYNIFGAFLGVAA